MNFAEKPFVEFSVGFLVHFLTLVHVLAFLSEISHRQNKIDNSESKSWTGLYLLEEKGRDKGCRRLDVPFGNEEVLTEGTRGAEITKGGMEVMEVRDMGANGVIADTDVGMDRFGILPIPRAKSNNSGFNIAEASARNWISYVRQKLHKATGVWITMS